MSNKSLIYFVVEGGEKVNEVNEDNNMDINMYEVEQPAPLKRKGRGKNKEWILKDTF